MECVHCKKSETEVTLYKCEICFRHYCDDHGYLMSGRKFCSQYCAEYFFHSDPDE